MIDVDYCISHPYRCRECGTRFVLQISLDIVGKCDACRGGCGGCRPYAFVNNRHGCDELPNPGWENAVRAYEDC